MPQVEPVTGAEPAHNAALGFAGISPVVGLYAGALVGTLVVEPARVWVLPVALAGQCLLLVAYAEPALEFRIAGGASLRSRAGRTGVRGRRRATSERPGADV